MGKFKVGDRVRDISGHHDIFKKGLPATGTISDRKCGGWVIDWDYKEIGRVSWHDNQIELVEETGPVRTVTRKEIVPGTYGRVVVRNVIEGNRLILRFEKDRGCDANLISLSSDEIRDAIATLTELADALDEA